MSRFYFVWILNDQLKKPQLFCSLIFYSFRRIHNLCIYSTFPSTWLSVCNNYWWLYMTNHIWRTVYHATRRYNFKRFERRYRQRSDSNGLYRNCSTALRHLYEPAAGFCATYGLLWCYSSRQTVGFSQLKFWSNIRWFTTKLRICVKKKNRKRASFRIVKTTFGFNLIV